MSTVLQWLWLHVANQTYNSTSGNHVTPYYKAKLNITVTLTLTQLTLLTRTVTAKQENLPVIHDLVHNTFRWCCRTSGTVHVQTLIISAQCGDTIGIPLCLNSGHGWIMNEGFCGEVSFSSVPVCCVGNWACRLRLAEDYGYSIVMVRFSIGVRLCHCFPVTQQYSSLFNRMSILLCLCRRSDVPPT